MRSAAHEVFPLEEFPVLTAHFKHKLGATLPCVGTKYIVRRGNKISKRAKRKRTWPLIEEKLYGDHGEDVKYDKWTDLFVAAHATGALISLDRNCKQWLTKHDGQYAPAKWTDEMEEALSGCYRENIKLLALSIPISETQIPVDHVLG